MKISAFLKAVLALDAASCLAMGSGLAIGGAALAGTFGLAPRLVLGAGLALIPLGLFILWVATRQRTAPLFVYAIIGGNLLWVIESLILAQSAGITRIGALFVTGQAVAVGLVTLLEAIGLVRVKASERREQPA